MQQILKIHLFWPKEFYNNIKTSFSDHIKMHSYHSICTLLYRFSINFEHGSVKLTCTCCNFVFNHRFRKRKSGSLPLSSPIETSKKHLGFSFSDILAKNSAEKILRTQIRFDKELRTRVQTKKFVLSHVLCHMVPKRNRWISWLFTGHYMDVT